MQVIWLVLLAVFLGVVSTAQNLTNGVAAGRIGLWATMVVNSGALLAGSLLFWALNRGWNASGDGKTPWYLLVGGVWGLAFLTGAAYVFPRLGAGPATALMVAAQLVVALALDHIGLATEQIPVTPLRLLGAALLTAGAILVLWPKLWA